MRWTINSRIVALLLSFSLFTSCEFAYKMHVTGKYYIIGIDTKYDLTLSYDLNYGSYVGKAPHQIIAYGFNDTFLVAKIREYRKSYPEYYIIDMTKDSEYALEETFRLGPFSESEYQANWKQKLNINLNIVE